MSTRAETGPMRFGDDWSGVFIRGDNAAGMLFPLRLVLERVERSEIVLRFDELIALRNVVQALAGSNDVDVQEGRDVQMMRSFEECKAT